MAPPTFGDLGKSSKDLLNKHHHAGFQKFNIKTNLPGDVGFNWDFHVNNETGLVQGPTFETKYNIQTHGVIMKQKWSNNIFTTELTSDNYLAPGLKATVSGAFAAQSGKRNFKINCGYKTPYFNLNSDLDFDKVGAVMTGTGVFGHQGWLAGMKVVFDPAKNKLNKTNFAVGYQASDFQITGFVDDGQDLNCSIHRRINENLDGAANVSWSSNSSPVKFALGCHHKINKEYAMRIKLNSTNQLHCSLIHRFSPSLMFTLSYMIDQLGSGPGHNKYGIGVDIDI